jgi:hypothetical protein
MRRHSFISLTFTAIVVTTAPSFAQTTYTVVPDSTVTRAPAPDSTAAPSTAPVSTAPVSTVPGSTAPSSAAPRSPESVLADPNSTPAEKRAAAAEIRAAVAAMRATAKEQSDAERERLKHIDALEPTTFTPDHETLNKFSYQAMFQADAFAALNQALAIQARTTRPTMTASETALFQALHSGQAGKYTFAEAALIASGVDDPAQRKQYLAKIDQIVAATKQETDKRRRIQAKADAICSYLFAGPMNAGYDENAFGLGQLLDTGHYSCVSSCLMFVVAARGVGLDVGAVVEPAHIVARVPGYDVQTTSGRIYRSTPFRLREIQDDVENDKELLGKFDPDHPYHEVRDFGILLEIYQNIANHAHDNKQFDQATIGALKEVFFDPTMPCAGHDLKVFLNDWFNAASTSNDVTTAAAIAQFYRQMARDPDAANEMDQCVVNLKKQLAKH